MQALCVSVPVQINTSRLMQDLNVPQTLQTGLKQSQFDNSVPQVFLQYPVSFGFCNIDSLRKDLDLIDQLEL